MLADALALNPGIFGIAKGIGVVDADGLAPREWPGDGHGHHDQVKLVPEITLCSAVRRSRVSPTPKAV